MQVLIRILFNTNVIYEYDFRYNAIFILYFNKYIISNIENSLKILMCLLGFIIVIMHESRRDFRQLKTLEFGMRP